MKGTIPACPSSPKGGFQGSERDTPFPGRQRITLGQSGAREDSAQRGRGGSVLPSSSPNPLANHLHLGPPPLSSHPKPSVRSCPHGQSKLAPSRLQESQTTERCVTCSGAWAAGNTLSGCCPCRGVTHPKPQRVPHSAHHGLGDWPSPDQGWEPQRGPDGPGGGQLALTASDKGPHVSLPGNKSAPLKRYSAGKTLMQYWKHAGRTEPGRRGRSPRASGRN